MNRLKLFSSIIIVTVFSAVSYSQWAPLNATTGNIYNTNSGSVGIGTTLPETKLHVSGGHLTVSGNFGNQNSPLKFNLKHNGSYNYNSNMTEIHMGEGDGTNLDGKISYYYDAIPRIDIGHNSAIIASFLSNGNVGIGITSPKTLLHIKDGTTGNSGLTLLTLQSNYQSTSGPMAAVDYISFRGALDEESAKIGFHHNDGTSRRTAISFWTRDNAVASTEKFRIDYNGNIGIGISDPTDKLEIRTSGGRLTIGTATYTGNANGIGIYDQTEAGVNIGSYDGTYNPRFKLFVKPGSPSVYGFQTDWSNNTVMDFVIQNYQTNFLTIKGNTGNFGIGTTDPKTKLDVAGFNMYVAGHNGNPQYIGNWAGSGVWGIGAVDDGNNSIRISAVNHPDMTWNTTLPIRFDIQGSLITTGKACIGGSSSLTQLDVNGNNMYIGGHNSKPQFIANWASAGVWGIGATDNLQTNSIKIGAVSHPSMEWNNSISIQLDVNGTVHAKEVKIDLNGWADFVFAPDYKLRTLSEVEQHIKENGHLPEVPSAAEMQENGLSVSEMQTKLLQKVEELTLYVIEQNKKIEALEAKNKEYENKNQK